MPFLSDVAVRRLPDGRWRLLEPLTYKGERDTFTVPAGFVTDWATVPWWAQSIVPRTGLWDQVAALHDWLCEVLAGRQPAPVPCPTSRDVDGLFRRMLREHRVGRVRRWLMWAGVRWGALANPARRGGWLPDTLPVLAITLAALLVGLVLLAAAGHGASWILGLLLP